MRKITFLAEVQSYNGEGELETDWLESSAYSHSDKFASALEQNGYIVKQIVPEDNYKMW